MKRLMVLLACAFIVLALSACGGGGGGGDDEAVVVPPPAPASSPEGLYTGRTSSGRLATGIILDDNTFYILYSTIGFDDEIAGLVQGNLTLGDNTYTSTNAKDFNLEGLGVLAATVEGSYVEKQSTNGSVYYPALLETISYNTVYDAAYELTPSIATIAGSYSGEVVTSEGWETAALTISPTGILSGSGSSGCSVSGTVLPSTSGNTYNMTLTFGGSPCLFANQTLSGVSYYNTSDYWLTGVVINATRTNGVLFTGQKLPLTANAGPDQIAPIGTVVALSGSGSDPDGDTLSYKWAFVEKPTASLVSISDADSSIASFTPDVTGVYKVQLIVNDGANNSDPSFSTITSIPDGFFTLGNNKDDVARIQGTPTAITSSTISLSDTNRWEYGNGLTYVDFSSTDGTVYRWQNYDGSLNVIIVPGNNVTADTEFTIGSHKDDVARIQGTPTAITSSTISLSDTNRWEYGNGLTYVDFSSTDGTVYRWQNYDGSLLVR